MSKSSEYLKKTNPRATITESRGVISTSDGQKFPTAVVFTGDYPTHIAIETQAGEILVSERGQVSIVTQDRRGFLRRITQLTGYTIQDTVNRVSKGAAMAADELMGRVGQEQNYGMYKQVEKYTEKADGVRRLRG